MVGGKAREREREESGEREKREGEELVYNDFLCVSKFRTKQENYRQ